MSGKGDRVAEVGDEPDPRFTLANERTFLAWSRTAVALIVSGLAAGKLLEFGSTAALLAVALPPIVLGAAVGVRSYHRWEVVERALRLGQPLPLMQHGRLLAGALGALGVVVAAVVVVDAV